MASTDLSPSDTRPYFEQALRHGVHGGVITPGRLQTIQAEGARGMVQIANYFGSAHLRTELEIARARMVNLLSLHLEDQSNGDLPSAARSLRDNSLLSLSKSGSDMLRRLSALPTIQVIEDRMTSVEDQRNDLNDWTFAGALDLRGYREERSARQSVQTEIDLARWILKRFGTTAVEERFAVETQAVFMSAMLVLFVKDSATAMPTRVDCVRLINAMKRGPASPDIARWEAFVDEMPSTYEGVARNAKDDFLRVAMPRIRDQGRTADALLHGDDALNLFMLEDLDNDSSEYERLVSRQWHRITAGDAEDPKVIATILLRVASGLAPKSTLLKREAREIVKVSRSQGLDSGAVIRFIEAHVPLQWQSDLKRLWIDDLVTDAIESLSDDDPAFPDTFMSRAVTYLRKTCCARWVTDDR